MKNNNILILLILCCLAGTVSAQQLTRSYHAVSLSKVLEDLGKATDRYTVNFIYNELEDFTVTESFKNLSVPDAVRTVCGLYPIKITFDNDRIYVECTQNMAQKITGKVADNGNNPIEFANVSLLSPRDSSFINGGVTNENGDFVIPCNVSNVLVKVTCIGYKQCFHRAYTAHVGVIHMANKAYFVNGVEVKGERPQYKMTSGGMTVDVEHSLLSQMGTGQDVLVQLPRITVKNDGTIDVFAKGKPQIYINSKLVRDNSELLRLKSADIKSVDLITSPGAQYDATVEAVIRIKTKRKQGEGFSFRSDANIKYSHKWRGYEDAFLTYRLNGFELSGNLYWNNNYYGEDNHMGADIYANNNHVNIRQYVDTDARSSYLYGNIGASYDIDDNNSAGVSYTVSKQLFFNAWMNGGTQTIYRNGVLEGEVVQDMKRTATGAPEHEWNVYYTGKAGRLGIDFNGTYMWNKSEMRMHEREVSTTIQSRNINTQTIKHNRLVAGKLVLRYPVAKGELSMGSELSHTNTESTYKNEEGYIPASETDIHESNTAAFAEFQMPLGDFNIRAGLRFEHVKTDYYSFGSWMQNPSLQHNNWFPNLSVSWAKGSWELQLNYVNKTKRPSYNSLRNEVQYDNRYLYEGGNPYLRSARNHNIEFGATRKWLSVSAGYTYIKDAIVWTPTLYNGQEIAFLHNLNFNHSQNVYVSVVASPKFRWYQPTYEVDFVHMFFNAAKYDRTRPAAKPQWTFALKNKIVFDKTCFTFLNMQYKTDQTTDFMVSKHNGYINLGIIKTFFNKALTVNLSVNDLLKTDKEHWTLYGINANLSKDCYNYERNINLTVSYNFNTTRSKYKGTGAGNEEKRRL